MNEHPRPGSTLEKISKLKPVFKHDDEVVTTANAFGICNGASTIILDSEEAVKRHNLIPLHLSHPTMSFDVNPPSWTLDPSLSFKNHWKVLD